MRQVRGGIAVKCAGAAYETSTEPTEAEETAIYTENVGQLPSQRLIAAESRALAERNAGRWRKEPDVEAIEILEAKS